MTSKRNWPEAIKLFESALAGLAASGPSALDVEETFARWQEMATAIKKANKTIYLAGNGASASMASHFAADLSKNFGVRAQVFTDLSQLTAIANDIGYEFVYSILLERYASEGDMLVAISSSGSSPNILSAAKAAKARKVSIVTLSSFEPDNPLRTMGDLNFYVPAFTYGMAETCHAAILHYWMDGLTQ